MSLFEAWRLQRYLSAHSTQMTAQVNISTQKFQEEHWNNQVTIKLAKKHKTTRTPKCKKNYLVNRKRQTSGPVNTNNEILPQIDQSF